MNVSSFTRAWRLRCHSGRGAAKDRRYLKTCSVRRARREAKAELQGVRLAGRPITNWDVI